MPVRFLEHYRKADRIMLALIWLMFLFSLGLAFWHDTLMQAVIVGEAPAWCSRRCTASSAAPA